MARRSIYSRRQSMPAGTYDTPLADFLDAIPGYVNQYQQNQLQSQRYKDEKEYRAARDEVADKQKKLTNELNLIRSLPEYARAKAMSTSEVESISSLGESLEVENNAFNESINNLTGSDSENLTNLKKVLNSPQVISNPTRKKQVESKIKNLTNKSLLTIVEQYYTDNPDDPLKTTNLAMAKYDPEQALKNINKQEYNKLTGDRKTLKGRDGVYYYEDTKEIVFPGLKTKIPSGQSVKSLTALFDAERSNLTFRRSEMTDEQINDSELRMKNYRQQLEELLKVEPNLYDPFKNTTDPAKAESTKTIPGL
jgi:hypothetical protein